MTTRDIVVVGASAGGVAALIQLAGGLPANFSAAVLVVLHLPARSSSNLPAILERAGLLPAAFARNGEQLRPGRIYVAPPDQHLRLGGGRLQLSRGPKENNARPAIDVLFRSAARVFGPRVIGVVLSGLLGDGAVGLARVKASGGVAIVQDPEDAAFASMPQHAIDTAEPHYRVPIARMGDLIARLVKEPIAEDDVSDNEHVAKRSEKTDENDEEPALRPSRFGCPDCGGVLFEVGAEMPRFRCHVGHAFSLEGLLAQQDDKFEDALWAACRALSESADLTRRMAVQARERGQRLAASRFEAKANACEQRAAAVRALLEATGATSGETVNDAPALVGSPPRPPAANTSE
ncbi:MAG TPA: chemotaxis protein CheB [Myxococcaceae bacterium]|nr:chemotaxis protein CheB [Myxococcaceae bacterium]